MKLRIIQGADQGHTIDLTGDIVTMGRGRDNDVVLNEEGVSRHHCRLVRSGDAWVIEDLKSMNGVRINGERITEGQPIFPGDEIAICSQVLTLSPDVEFEEKVASTPVSEEPPKPVAVPSWGDGESAEAIPDARPRIPWARIALLAVVLLLIGVLGYQVLKQPGDEPVALNAAEEQPVLNEGGRPAVGDAPELSDADLAKLIEEEETSPRKPDVPVQAGVSPESPAGAKPDDLRASTPAPVFPDQDQENEPAPVTGGGGQDRAVSSLVLMTSDPNGASIAVDGKEMGTTPAVLRDLSPGRHMVVLSKPGYEPFDRQIHVPDLLPTRPYKLRLQAGALSITSEPAGAGVWHGTQLLGITPLLSTSLPPGEYTVGLTAPGCEPVKKTVTVSKIRGESFNFELASVLGSLEVVTDPPGCIVSVDAHTKGETMIPEGAPKGTPGRLVIAGLVAGEHLMEVKHPCGASRSGKVKIAKGETVRRSVKLWVPDTKLVLADGKVVYGRLAEQNEHGDVVIAENPRQFERYLKPQIAEIAPLSPEDAAQVLARLRGEGAGDDDADGDDGESVQGGDGGQADNKDEDAREEADDRKAEPPLHISADEIQLMFKQRPSAEINKHFQNRRVIITGVPSGSGKDGLGGYVSFGRHVRCFIDREAYEEQKEKLRLATEAGTPIQISGLSPGMRGPILVLRKSTLIEGKDQAE